MDSTSKMICILATLYVTYKLGKDVIEYLNKRLLLRNNKEISEWRNIDG